MPHLPRGYRTHGHTDTRTHGHTDTRTSAAEASLATVNDAIAIAARAHAGQENRLGEPFILHPLRMLVGLATDREHQIAALHDVVERTDWDLERLAAAGFDAIVLAAVDALTRREGEEYFEFVRRAIANPDALPVKRADLLDNLRTARREPAGERRQDRIARYERALRMVEEAAPGAGLRPAIAPEPGPATAAATDATTGPVDGVTSLPVAIGARVLALQQVDRARAAARRMAGGGDAEAIHDLRVALRRLRTLLGTYRRELRRAVGGKGRRAIRKLLRETARARDLEVRVTLLDDLAPADAEEAAVGWLRSAWRDEAERAASNAVDHVVAEHPRLEKRLRRRLARARLDAASAEGPTLAATLAGSAQDGVTDLENLLMSGSATSDEQIHAARLLVKRLRYTLEPLTSAADVRPAVAMLIDLQDLLGGLRDLSLFQEALTAGSPPADAARGVDALAQRVVQRKATLVDRLANEWLGPAAGRMLEPVRDLLDALPERR